MKVLRLLPMIIVMGSIFFLSHQPGDSLPYMELFPGQDKVEHFSIYLLLGLTVFFAVGEDKHQQAPVQVSLLVAGICLLYGITDEFHQSFIPGRDPDIWDVTADMVGGLAAAGLWPWLKKLGRRKAAEVE